MPSVPILQSHPVATLKKEISKTNIKGYSKMKKDALIQLMMRAENKPRFSHIKMREKAGDKPKEIIITPKRKIKAKPAAKKRIASIPKVIKAKARPVEKLTSNRDLVQALLDGATSLLPQRHINNPNSFGKRTDTMELLEKIKKSPALRKKLLDFKFRDNLYDEINTLINSELLRLQSSLGRDTATGKLKTVETSSRPKAVRELKEFLALPLEAKVRRETREVDNNTWGEKTQTGRALYNAMAEIVGKK